MAKSAKASSFKPQADGYVEDMLIKAGWRRHDDGWKHKRLNGGQWAWPAMHAARLQTETDDGMQGEIYDMLRGK